MPTLAELRREWEKGAEVLVEVEREKSPDFSILWTLVGWPDGDHRVNRYFPIFGEWAISVDFEGSRGACLKFLQEQGVVGKGAA